MGQNYKHGNIHRLSTHFSYKRDPIIKLPAPLPLCQGSKEESLLAGRDTKGLNIITA